MVDISLGVDGVLGAKLAGAGQSAAAVRCFLQGQNGVQIR